MFEFFSLLLEAVLITIIVFVITVNLQRFSMESIWGDPLDSVAGDSTASGDHEGILEDGDEAHYQDQPENKSGEEETPSTNGNSNITYFDEDKGYIGQVYVKDSTADGEDCTHTQDRVEISTYIQTKENTDDIVNGKNSNRNNTTYLSDGTAHISENFAISTDCQFQVFDKPGNTCSKDFDEVNLENLLKFDFDFENSETNKYIISVPKCTLLSEVKTDAFIKIVDISNKMSRVYELNGDSFVDEEMLSQHDNDDYDEYAVYQVAQAREDDDVDFVSTLELHIQRLPQGVIINSNVFLWDAQWHTMVLLDSQLFQCAVCLLYCDKLACESHVETSNHLQNLDRYRPLKRFDLSIVRKIYTSLHCGVCNEIFDVIDYKQHENSKKHEENLLTAINKVSDLMYDSNIHASYGEKNFFSGYRNLSNSDRFPSSDTRASSSDRLASSSDRLASSADRLTSSYERLASSSDRRASSSERNVFRNPGEYHFDANAINNNINNISECEEESECSDKEDSLSEEECEEMYEEEEEIEEYNTPYQGVSYASMASKPTIQLPKFLKIDLGTKEVRVKFESWHMITKIESNKFYCMVCSKRELIRFKSQHCVGCEHVERLARCTVVKAFEDYLIRKVDDKLYHCGHCNNLQYHNQIEDHIESAHPKKNRNYVETNNLSTKRIKTDKSNTKTVIEPKKTESDKRTIVNKNIDYTENELNNEVKTDSFDVFGDIPLSPFGCELWIPALNFNFIMKVDGDYYCALCDKVCGDVTIHVEEMDHVELMTMAPFIKPFQNHLTRVINGMFHCSLCNELFPISKVSDHNMDQPHTTALAKAMGMKKSQKPLNTKGGTVLNLEDNYNAKTIPPLHLPATANTQNFQIQKENIKPLINQATDQNGAQKSNVKPEMSQSSDPLTVFNAAVAAALNSYKENGQSTENLMSALKIRQNQQNNGLLLQAGQNASHLGQNLLHNERTATIFGQNQQQPAKTSLLPTPGQNLPQAIKPPLLPIPGQTLPTHGQNLPQAIKPPLLPTPGQTLPAHGQNLPQTIKPPLLPSPGHTLPTYGQNVPQAIKPPLLPSPGQTLPTHGQNLLQARKHPLLPTPGQTLPTHGQNLPQAIKPPLLPTLGHTLPTHGQNLPQAIKPPLLPTPGQTLPTHGHNLPQPIKAPLLPTPGQNLPQAMKPPLLPSPRQMYPFPQTVNPQPVNPQMIKSIPPMFNAMFPQLPPVNTEILKSQFVGTPLVFNYPRHSVSPFPNSTPNNSPNLLSPNTNQDTERRTIIISDRNISGNDKSKPDRDNFRPDNRKNRKDSDISRPDSENSSKNIRRDSDISRPDSDNFRSDSLMDVEMDSRSDGDEFKEFDEEEMVFVKLKTTYFKITNMSYNTLVFLDNGIRYCFVCSSEVYASQLLRHVESRKHLNCLRDNKFLDKYGVQLFRQMYLMYHCAICNELMTRKEIKLHLDWSGHVECYNSAHLILNKKNRKELKSGLKEYVVETQKEAIFHNVNEPNYQVRAAYQIVPNLDVNKDAQENRPAKGSKSTALKKNKMIIQNNVVMKIPFDHWHGITSTKNITKCVICQLEITQDEVLEHVETDYHAVALGKTFEKSYQPELIRKINDNTVNCMTCNLELPNNEVMIHEHVDGRKHNKNRENIVNETSNSDSYADCYEDYLNV